MDEESETKKNGQSGEKKVKDFSIIEKSKKKKYFLDERSTSEHRTIQTVGG